MKTIQLRSISAIFKLLFLTFIIFACEKNAPEPDDEFRSGKGFFFVNEGGFNQGNGSLSYYSYDTSVVFNKIFSEVNGRILGDIPNSVSIIGEGVYIVVNNSGKIEVAERETLVTKKTIEGLNSPRRILKVDQAKAYVSSLYSDSLIIIDIDTCMVAGSVYLGKSSEAMILLDSRVFVANWSGGSSVSVVDATSDTLIAVIQLRDEPCSMQMDKNNNLWVLCSGGYMSDQYPALYCIDPDDYSIINELEFASMSDYPTELEISGSGDTLYYLNQNIYRVAITDNQLPLVPFVNSFNRNLYKLGYDDDNNYIVVTDAVDYMQRGYLYIYTRSGKILDMENADIIPGSMSF
ncbi:MAG TPA: DUF5074 domain-containing protein [Bacteroidales bacterium]|nr:DUF5074 domain-containing protein [Bacteroidales bacterium]